jgi:hypothetical protein
MGKRKPQRSLEEQRMVIYRERNRNIRAMGFASYTEYLKSDLWESIRATVLSADNTCWVCGTLATQVHHTKYRKKDLAGRDLAFLKPICAGCHRFGEFDKHGVKLTPKLATRRMKIRKAALS